MSRNNTRQFLSDSLVEIINYSKVGLIFKNIPMEKISGDKCTTASDNFADHIQSILLIYGGTTQHTLLQTMSITDSFTGISKCVILLPFARNQKKDYV
jgi:hypothetical protein